MSDTTEQEQEFSNRASAASEDSASHPWDEAKKELTKSVENGLSSIVYGPPGTGKTRIIQDLLNELKTQDKLGRAEVVQFHQKFSYEDFIEGYSPTASGGFEKRDGVFKQFIKEPSQDGKVDIFVIDEINRADITSTFGELLFLLDDKGEREVKTSHFGDVLKLPTNLVIIGTMNTADRNIAVVDFALRRRFQFIPLNVDYDVLRGLLSSNGFTCSDLSVEELITAIKKINSRISSNRLMGRHMELGQALWLPKSKGELNESSLVDVFVMTIIPQLEAYLGYGYEDGLSAILNSNVAEKYLKNQVIKYDDIKGLVKDLNNKAA